MTSYQPWCCDDVVIETLTPAIFPTSYQRKNSFLPQRRSPVPKRLGTTGFIYRGSGNIPLVKITHAVKSWTFLT